MSCVAWSTIMADVCLSTCGCSRFVDNDEHVRRAVVACRRSTYANPQRVIDPPRALTKSSGTEGVSRTANHARMAVAVLFQRGSARSRRPLENTINYTQYHCDA